MTADLTCDLAADSALLELWRRTLAYSQDRAPDQMDSAMAALGKMVAPLPDAHYRDLLGSAGFDRPTRFFQAVLMQGWFAQSRPA